jgi:endonuclease YncB( thermonuclease family)
MFGRRKKSDGFEWHRYVPTVIRQRREARHQRVLEARRAAAQQMSAAGSALAAGSMAAGAAARDGARAGLGAAGLAAQSIWGIFLDLCLLLGRVLVAAVIEVMIALARPRVGGPVALLGAIVLGAGIGRYRGMGLDGEAAITLGIGIVLLIATLPIVFEIVGLRLPSARAGAIGVAVVALLGGAAAWFASGGGRPDLAGITGSITSRLPIVGAGTKPLQGRAQALSGELIRVAGTTVRLAGIEAPDRQQTCGSGRRRSRCGAAAESALERLVDGRSVSCMLSGSDDRGRPLATCTRGNTDIGAELVRQGRVFASSGLFATYASLEQEARAAKIGIWAAGEPERPADFRARTSKGDKRQDERGS